MRRWQNQKAGRSERWKREDEATRLSEEIPALKTLQLELSEQEGGEDIPGASRKRHIVVPQAAAMFEIACSENKCEEGGHDITQEALNFLREGKTKFNGQHACNGNLTGEPCKRVLFYVATAAYSSDE